MRTKLKIDLPSDIIRINEIFKANGFKLFVVGGAVRDALLNQKPKDFDLATDALPDEVNRMLGPVFKMLPLGEAFGIWQAFTPTGEFEIATFRTDVSYGTSGRRPDEVIFTTIEGDVKRRDLTINALFFDIDTSEVIDLVGGVEDIKNSVVRAVGSARDRFAEDKLRILRAIRFAARFDCKLDSDIQNAIKEDKTPISGDGKRLSNERIRDEFLKGIKTAKDVGRFMSMLQGFGLFEWVFGDLKAETCSFTGKDHVLLIALMISRGNTLEKISKTLNKLTFTNEECKSITFLASLAELSADTAIQIKKKQFIEVDKVLVPVVTNEQIREFAKHANIDEDLVEVFIRFKLSVTGKDAMDAGVEKGPAMGKFIKDVEDGLFLIMLDRKFEKL